MLAESETWAVPSEYLLDERQAAFAVLSVFLKIQLLSEETKEGLHFRKVLNCLCFKFTALEKALCSDPNCKNKSRVVKGRGG